MANDLLDQLTKEVRGQLAERLASGQAAGDAARLLADLEVEVGRRTSLDSQFRERTRQLTDASPDGGSSDFLRRPLPLGLDSRAVLPRQTRAPSPQEAARGVVCVYAVANPTFYRSIIDRLEPGERFRMESAQHGTYELTKDDFERELPGIATSRSYLQGPPSAPGTARYVQGRPLRGIAQAPS